MSSMSNMKGICGIQFRWLPVFKVFSKRIITKSRVREKASLWSSLSSWDSIPSQSLPSHRHARTLHSGWHIPSAISWLEHGHFFFKALFGMGLSLRLKWPYSNVSKLCAKLFLPVNFIPVLLCPEVWQADRSWKSEIIIEINKSSTVIWVIHGERKAHFGLHQIGNGCWRQMCWWQP